MSPAEVRDVVLEPRVVGAVQGKERRDALEALRELGAGGARGGPRRRVPETGVARCLPGRVRKLSRDPGSFGVVLY